MNDYTDDTICWILYVGVYSDLKPQDRMIVRQQLTKRGIACIEDKATKRINSNRENYHSDNNKVMKNKSNSSDALPNCKGDYWNNCVGTYTYHNGDQYVGEWKDDKLHGQGTYTYGSGSEWSGDKYVGGFKEGKQHGQGTYTFAEGDKYVGEWKDDKQHGQGTYTYDNGDQYVGEWKDGKSNGQGTYTYGSGSEWSGDQYVGEWKDNKKQMAKGLTHLLKVINM